MPAGKRLFWGGLLLLLAGVAYDTLFAGIPFQDPTPALERRYVLHASIAGWIQVAGLILLLLALHAWLAKRRGPRPK